MKREISLPEISRFAISKFIEFLYRRIKIAVKSEREMLTVRPNSGGEFQCLSISDFKETFVFVRIVTLRQKPAVVFA